MAATVLRVWLFSMLFSCQVGASALPCFFDSFDDTGEMTVLKDEGEFGLESLNGRAGPTTLVTFFALPSFKIIYILITAQHWQGDKACLRFPSGPLPREVLPLLPLWLERQSQTNGHSGSGHALWGRDIFCVQFLKVKATNLGFFYHNSAHIQFPAHWMMRFPWCHSWAPILPWRRCDQLLLLSPLKTVWKSNTRSQFLWIHCWEKKIWSNRKTYFNHKYWTGFMGFFFAFAKNTGRPHHTCGPRMGLQQRPSSLSQRQQGQRTCMERSWESPHSHSTLSSMKPRAWVGEIVFPRIHVGGGQFYPNKAKTCVDFFNPEWWHHPHAWLRALPHGYHCNQEELPD